MTPDSTDPFDQAERDLAAWHSTHPRATRAQIEAAVEQQIERLRTHLLSEHAQAGFHQERPVCPQCGASMLPRARSTRTLLLRGDQSLELERSYVVCPSCGEGLFPPG